MGQSYQAAISFGLIHIPVTFHRAVVASRVSFNMIDRKSGDRVRYQKRSAKRDVDKSEIVKGVKHGDDYVKLEKEDLQSLPGAQSQLILIEQFCTLNEIDPLLYNKAYYLKPKKNAERPFLLLLKAMEKAKKVAVARLLLKSGEHLAMMTIREGQLFLFMLHYYQDLVEIPKTGGKEALSAQELKLANSLISSLTKKFVHKSFTNNYQEALNKLIETKARSKGNKKKTRRQPEPDGAGDLLAALAQSLKTSPRPRA